MKLLLTVLSSAAFTKLWKGIASCRAEPQKKMRIAVQELYGFCCSCLPMVDCLTVVREKSDRNMTQTWRSVGNDAAITLQGEFAKAVDGIAEQPYMSVCRQKSHLERLLVQTLTFASFFFCFFFLVRWASKNWSAYKLVCVTR